MTTGGLTTQPEPWHKGSRRDSSADGITEYLRAIGIYLASDQRYTEAELPTSFGPKTGTPEQGIDHTFILYAGPGLQP